MRKLVFFVIGLFALFTLIKAYTSVRAAEDAMPPAASTQVTTTATQAGISGLTVQPQGVVPVSPLPGTAK